MGRLIDGVWHENDPPQASDGRFRRPDSTLRNWITRDGRAGVTGRGGFRAEAGRYHLYVAMTCPWAHRTALLRKLKRLEDLISISYVAPRRSAEGWIFDPEGGHDDPLHGCEALHEVYTRSEPTFSGRVTVPVLWDCETSRIVNNESADIVRMLNHAFCDLAPGAPDFYPEPLRARIDQWNEEIYRDVNNGVYRSGFASSQSAYEEAVETLFDCLDRLDRHLASSRYLAGATLTEADWRLFPTLARFDVAYVGAFRCNLQRLSDYAHLWPYARELYQVPGVAETVDFETFKRGYYSPSRERNPHGIVPLGPCVSFDEPHGRGAP